MTGVPEAALGACPERAAISESDRRGTVMKAAAEARTRQVLVRLTPEEHDELTRAARGLALTNPEYLRLCWGAARYLDDIQETSHA
jgi:hypothetical protein